jgi:hypothetical protein
LREIEIEIEREIGREREKARGSKQLRNLREFLRHCASVKAVSKYVIGYPRSSQRNKGHTENRSRLFLTSASQITF